MQRLTPQAAGWEPELSDAWLYAVEIIPKIGAFTLIMITGGLTARLIIMILDRQIERAGCDNLLDRGGITRVLHRPARELRTAMLRLLLAIMLLVLLQLALGVFGTNPLRGLVHDLISLLADTLAACALLILGATLASAARRFVAEALEGLPYADAAATASAAAVMVGFGKASLDELGLATSVTTPMLYALLATITGVVVVGVGGGLIRPMQHRWEAILRRGEPEYTTVRSTWRDNRARAAAAEPMVVPVNDLVGDLVAAGHAHPGCHACARPRGPADPASPERPLRDSSGTPGS